MVSLREETQDIIEYIIGIDLGTTNSAVAVIRPNIHGTFHEVI